MINPAHAHGQKTADNRTNLRADHLEPFTESAATVSRELPAALRRDVVVISGRLIAVERLRREDATLTLFLSARRRRIVAPRLRCRHEHGTKRAPSNEDLP